MKQWLAQHSQALELVLTRFKNNMMGTLLIALAIGVTLALPVTFFLVLNSVSELVSDVKKESHISVFLKLDHDNAMIENIESELRKISTIKSFQFVPKEEALEQLIASSGNKDLINSLEKNPLPDAFFIESELLSTNAIETIKEQVSTLDGVDQVQSDGAWLKRLNYLLTLGKKAMLVLTFLLGFALFAVIGNTIRMQILTQHDEIEVSQLIGATKGFIRRPFLYAGAFYGFLGGLLAIIISSIVALSFNQTLSALAAEYQANFSIGLPNIHIFMSTCLIAIAIGLVSAYLVVSKSLLKTIN